MFLSLYTDKAKGILSEHRFMKLTAALEQEQESDIRTFIREIRQYTAIKELDETMLHRLINKVLIDKVKKVDGQNVQEIRIVYSPIK